MQGNRRWLGWVAIALGALALLVALGGRGFGPQIANGFGASRQQPYAQSDAGQQGRPAAPGANAQPGAGQQQAGPQAAPAAPGANAQREGRSQGRQTQGGQAGPGANTRREGGPERNGGFGLGWLNLPFKLIGGSFQTGMLILVALLGVWLLRGRNAASAASGRSAAPAQGPQPEPQSPTGESYIDEPSDPE